MTRIVKSNVVRHLQCKCAPCLQNGGFRSPNHEDREVFGSLYHALIMYEMVDPSTSRSVRLACAGDLKEKYERWNQKGENEDQIVVTNTN